jgi:hypothetical protein
VNGHRQIAQHKQTKGEHGESLLHGERRPSMHSILSGRASALGGWKGGGVARGMQPQLYEVEPSMFIQSDLVMADGSEPPSYANSEIAREDAEEMMLMGRTSTSQSNDDTPRIDGDAGLPPPQPARTSAPVDPGQDFLPVVPAPPGKAGGRREVEAQAARLRTQVATQVVTHEQPRLRADGVAQQADIMMGDHTPGRESPAPSYAPSSAAEEDDDDVPSVLKPSMNGGALDDQDDII